MKVWILFIWLHGGLTTDIHPHKTKAACEEAAEMYKRTVCVLVEVPPK